ncbi:MAG: hypothetical protein CVU53_05645 [Deltaproteobacteria bacterium HGW-Deltaproteobacteria-11]|nr:MAG: hypothetical protein CVU53_05645 [Deltaproteobacteria bacterium HGW-Deltaproteobacteria-11]
MKKLLHFLLFVSILGTSVSSFAVERGDPLKGQPAVRKRVLYLPGRFEVTPSVGVSFLQDYRHSFLVGAKAEYHLNDYLSFGFAAHFSPFSMNTGLTDEIQATLPNQLEDDTWVNPTPSKNAMMDALNEIKLVMGPHITYTPAFGKMGLFSTVFFNFDVYFFGGLGIVMFEAGDLSPYTDTPAEYRQAVTAGTAGQKLHIIVEEENGGLRFGPQAGLGFHFYLNSWMAVNMEFRWMYVKRNAAGFDRNGDRIYELIEAEGMVRDWVVVNNKDESWENTMFFHFGLSMFFPQFAPRSN